MRRGILVLFGACLLAFTSGSASAQCLGDCDGSGDVAVNELITGVNIALGNANVDACPAFDGDSSGDVTINELIMGVNNALNGCDGGGGVCGDGMEDSGEECDDGNTDGGDGCAANCTDESDITCNLADTSGATVQTTLFAIPLSVSGQQIITHGGAGDDGVIPIVIKEDNMIIDPVPVPGLVCACLRGAAMDEFGPGNAAAGSLGCGESGLAEVSYRVSIDHNIDDELGGEDCPPEQLEGPDDMHPGVCNGETTLTITDGGPRGSVLMDAAASIGLIADGGTCSTDPSDPAKGPDGIPCTADDPDVPEGQSLPFTTGTAASEVIDVNNRLGVNMGPGEQCGAAPCMASIEGSPVNCDLIESDPDGALSGSNLVGALASIDTDQISDNLVTARFACE